MFACASALGYTDAQILKAIGMVESRMNRGAIGDAGLALGAYQMHRAAWIDANAQLVSEGRRAHSRSFWRVAKVQDEVALAYLRVIRKRFRMAGLGEPTPAMIAACWNKGFSGAMKAPSSANRYASLVETELQKLSFISLSLARTRPKVMFVPPNQ
jgi:hypothetical protein